MEVEPKIFISEVMHKRLFPKVNKFTYGLYYLACPISKLDQLDRGVIFGYNRFALFSFYDKDHGDRSGADLDAWIRNILKQEKITKVDGEIILVTMPRILGYIFNPVSFWLCLDKKNNLRAVISEVNNTFGETHNYVCAKKGQAIITKNDYIEAEKLFHVSPFLKREGKYKFRFSYTKNKLGIWIDFFNKDSKKQLLTSLVGKFIPSDSKVLLNIFWKYPLITLKTILLIHWQAIKLVFKGIKYVPKPKQYKKRVS